MNPSKLLSNKGSRPGLGDGITEPLLHIWSVLNWRILQLLVK